MKNFEKIFLKFDLNFFVFEFEKNGHRKCKKLKKINFQIWIEICHENLK
jgi:hypothetical protein